MKTTIEIADDLIQATHDLARKKKTTFARLIEEGLRLVLAGNHRVQIKKLPQLVTFGEGGLNEEFKNWNWDQTRAEVYGGR
jgi:hypothetical protein